MTNKGSVFAGIYDQHHLMGWAVLDRSNETWQRVGGYPGGNIIGSRGNDVIFSEHDGSGAVLRAVSAASLQIEKSEQAVAAGTQ